MADLVTEVDKEDHVIGNRVKNDFYRTERIHRSSHLLLFNPKGELLLQRRAFKNKLYPGAYDFSVGGFVDAGESYRQAVDREMKEELGISVKPWKLFKFFYGDEVNKAFKTVYTAIYDGEFSIQQEELDSIRWTAMEELKKELADHPEQFNPSFVMGMEIYFSKT